LAERKDAGLGVYPDVSLADARARRDEARKLLANGIDPVKKEKLRLSRRSTYFRSCH
jgi:hypothetical protein